MKWLSLVLIASVSFLAACEDASWTLAVNNTESDIFFSTQAAAGETRMYSAYLTGADEVPSTSSEGTGVARFHLMKDGSIRWSLRTSDVDSVIAAHIHAGVAGQIGPVIVGLFGGGPEQDIHVRGEITDPGDIEAVLALFHADSAYVNVHTTAHEGGEVRGQVVPKTTGGGGGGQD